jgi:hypothetical protein
VFCSLQTVCSSAQPSSAALQHLTFPDWILLMSLGSLYK